MANSSILSKMNQLTKPLKSRPFPSNRVPFSFFPLLYVLNLIGSLEQCLQQVITRSPQKKRKFYSNETATVIRALQRAHSSATTACTHTERQANNHEW